MMGKSAHLAQANPNTRIRSWSSTTTSSASASSSSPPTRAWPAASTTTCCASCRRDPRVAGAGRRDRRRHDRQEGRRLPPHREGRLARHAPGRQAARRAADRRGQGACSTRTPRARSTRSSSCYNDFVNTMTQEPIIRPAAAAAAAIGDARRQQHDWDYIYEPDARDRARAGADALRRVAGVPGGAREHGLRTAARMVAMKAASDNANKVIDS